MEFRLMSNHIIFRPMLSSTDLEGATAGVFPALATIFAEICATRYLAVCSSTFFYAVLSFNVLPHVQIPNIWQLVSSKTQRGENLSSQTRGRILVFTYDCRTPKPEVCTEKFGAIQPPHPLLDQLDTGHPKCNGS